MTAFLALLDRTGSPVDSGRLGGLARDLAPGSELHIRCRGPVGLAVTDDPDPRGRRPQPIEEVGGGLLAVLIGHAGRVRGGAAPEPGAALDSGSELLDLHRREPDIDALRRCAGSFVLVVADPVAPALEVVRDHLGSREVFFREDARWLLVASEPTPILRHFGLAPDPDESAVARFFGIRAGLGGRSFFRGIDALPPASRLLSLPAKERSVNRWWRFAFRVPSLGLPPEPETVEEGFRRRLRLSIERELAGVAASDVALSLSSGLDSTALAALGPRDVRLFSWTLSSDPEGDETSRVGTVARHLGREVCWIPGDGLEPLVGDFAERFVEARSPLVNAFAALKTRLYEAAWADGCRIVMVGDAGDVLTVPGRDLWLRDALARRAPGAGRDLLRTATRAARGDRAARTALRRCLPWPDLRERLLGPRVPWLTPTARRLLRSFSRSPLAAPGGDARFEPGPGARHLEQLGGDRPLFERSGVGRSDPFWDWPLLEWSFAVPADRLDRPERPKILARRALDGLLPPEIVDSPRVGLLGRFFLRGLETRRDWILETVIRAPRSDWARYVHRDLVGHWLDTTDVARLGHTVLWRVICYELWIRRLFG